MERCCAEKPTGETSLDPIARNRPHVGQKTNTIWHLPAPDVTAVAEKQQVAYYQ
jgi:hypothetical protein